MKHHGWNLCLLGWVLMSIAAFGEEPRTLERAPKHALAHNPETQPSRHRVTAAQAGLEQANAAFWLRLKCRSDAGRVGL